MKHFELYRLNVDKRPRIPARCPFYLLDTERNNTVAATSIIALVIILGLGFWRPREVKTRPILKQSRRRGMDLCRS